MKLTNLSLSILVALGLIACGGSDDNSNAAADNNNAGHQHGGKGGSGDTSGNQNDGKTADSDKDKKDENKSGIDPNRVAPDLKVPADLQTVVNSRKKSFIDRGFSDASLGYEQDGKTYKKKFSTDPANIKWTSTYNFADEDDVYALGPQKGAIFVGGTAPNANNLNAWAKGQDGRYYRVKSTQPLASYKEGTPFEIVSADADDQKGFGVNDYQSISQDKVVFIANTNDNLATKKDVIKLGDVKTTGNYDFDKAQVILNTISALDTTYNAYSTGQELNLSKLPVKKEIQTVDVTGKYSIINGKTTAQATDDKVIEKEINIGHIKAYNLPYSAAYVTTDASNENKKNIFNLGTGSTDPVDGAFQVVGLQTVSLPKDGRAFYKGKSFSASTVGDVDLVADFFSDRAGIVGAITNRKDIVKNKALPELTLNRITLTDPEKHYITGANTVSGQDGYDVWSVTMYGLEAQEAAGYIGAGIHNDNKASFTEIKEVFNTQRGALSNHSNTPDTKK